MTLLAHLSRSAHLDSQGSREPALSAHALLFSSMLALAAGVLRYRTVRVLRPPRKRLRSLLEAAEREVTFASQIQTRAGFAHC